MSVFHSYLIKNKNQCT